MTAEWEEELLKIEKGKADARDFQKKMEKYTACITDELLQTSVAKTNLPYLFCPKCNKEQLIITSKIVKCPNDVCSWFQFRNVCGVQLSIYDIESLVSRGKTHLIKAMQSKTGKKFDAYIKLNNKAESSFEFEKVQTKE